MSDPQPSDHPTRMDVPSGAACGEALSSPCYDPEKHDKQGIFRFASDGTERCEMSPTNAIEVNGVQVASCGYHREEAAQAAAMLAEAELVKPEIRTDGGRDRAHPEVDRIDTGPMRGTERPISDDETDEWGAARGAAERAPSDRVRTGGDA